MTADSNPPAAGKPRRVERLCQVMAAAAVLWAIVSVVRAYRGPPPLQLADQAVAEGQLPTAVEGYLAHLIEHPQDWQARLELAGVLVGIDRLQALVELRKIPPDAAEYLPALRQIAQLCLSGQRDGEAKEALLALEAGAPQDPWAQISLAEVFRRQGALALALHHAQRGAELDPSPPGTHFLIAELLDDLDRQAEMIAPLRKVIERQPDHYAAHLNLAYAYSQAGQPNGTRKEAEWCLVRNPNDVDARRLLATAARDEGRHAEAKEELKKALALSPDDINCRLLEAELLLFDRQAEAAFQRLQPLYPHYPKEARVLGLLAQAATAAGRPAEAEKYRQQIENLKKR